tara:strand:+ start:177 stop:614 length:438 start_codon:yes stop_codon:yes gene_type:complete
MTKSLPKNSKLFKNIQRDSDSRGSILSIVEHPIQNVSIIETYPNSFRSNHYHHKDFHFMYVLEGEIDYFYKSIDKNDTKMLKIKTGETILTPPNEIHSCYFPKFCKLVVSSGFPRDQKTYEKDTVRVKFINDENIKMMIEKYGRK